MGRPNEVQVPEEVNEVGPEDDVGNHVEQLVGAPLRGRGRPRLSEEERQERQQRYLDARVRDREDDRIRGLPVSQRRLAGSARGTRQITDFFKKRRVEGEGVQEEQ